MTTAPAVGQRERILDQALDLMASRGAQAMTMRNLAGACGIAVSGLYYYFPSKKALLAAVIQNVNGMFAWRTSQTTSALSPRLIVWRRSVKRS